MRRAGLPEDLLAQKDVRLSTEDFFRLWKGIEAEINDPLLPIRFGNALTAESFSPPLFAALCSPNLRIAAQRLSMYKPLIGPMSLNVYEGQGTFSVSFRWPEGSPAVPPTLIAVELVFIVALTRMATREKVKPVSVTTIKPPEPAEEFEKYFGVPVLQASEHSIKFSESDAVLPFLTANERLFETFDPDLRRRLKDLDESAAVADRVNALLLEFLPSGRCSMEDISDKLIMSKRTLQRRLHSEGTTFQELLKNTRKDLATHYLANSALTSSEISFLLGYEDANSFFRAFNDWTGTTPESVRLGLELQVGH
jgi:AraC-like DNA-binding protein